MATVDSASRARPPAVLRLLRSGNHHLRQVVKVAINYRGKRDYTLRQEAFDLVRPFAPAVACERDGVRYFVSTQDYGLSRIVFCQGSYEQDIMASSLAIAERCVGVSSLLNGRVFVDIGANIGTSTIPALKTFGASEAVAIEPDTENYKLLRCNVIANDLDERVKTVQVALSSQAGAGVMEWAAGSWGDHRIRMATGLPDGSFHESSRPTVPVALARFDDIAARLPIDLERVGVVWMDVQGHEGHVLAGAESLLASEIPVILEYWPYGLRRAGGLAMLHDIMASSYNRIIDIRATMGAGDVVEVPGTGVGTLADRYPGETYTDLLLLK